MTLMLWVRKCSPAPPSHRWILILIPEIIWMHRCWECQPESPRQHSSIAITLNGSMWHHFCQLKMFLFLRGLYKHIILVMPGSVHMTACSSSHQFHMVIAEPDQIYVKELSHCNRQGVLTADITVFCFTPHRFWTFCEKRRRFCILRLLETNRWKSIVSIVIGWRFIITFSKTF